MKVLRVKDNSVNKKESFEEISKLVCKIADKTLEQVGNEGNGQQEGQLLLFRYIFMSNLSKMIVGMSANSVYVSGKWFVCLRG